MVRGSTTREAIGTVQKIIITGNQIRSAIDARTTRISTIKVALTRTRKGLAAHLRARESSE